MNMKNVVIVASIIAILGLGTAVAFSLITLEAFGMISVAVLTSLFGLVKQFENKELKQDVENLKTQKDLDKVEKQNLKNQKRDLQFDLDNLSASFLELKHNNLEKAVELSKNLVKKPANKTK